MRSRGEVVAAFVLAWVVGLPASVSAQAAAQAESGATEPPASAPVQSPSSFRLQSSAFGGAQPGMALLAMHGTGKVGAWATADALVWGGLRDDDDGTGDVLVMSLSLRDPEGRGEGTIGRFVVGPGAIRPIHIDGAIGRLRMPGQLRLEAFGGIPVMPEFDHLTSEAPPGNITPGPAPSATDGFGWVAGGRLSRAIGARGSVGVAYALRRHDGDMVDEEVGVDIGAAVTDWLDVNGKLAYDLINPGISEILASAAFYDDDWRAQLRYTERSPSRILPATSLFSVLGDVASRRGVAMIDWRPAPRLDLQAAVGARWIGDEPGESIQAQARLRLNDEGTSVIWVEGRREGAPEGDWSGARAAGRIRIIEQLTASAEVELVFPDDPQGRGKIWPWALLGLEWAPVPAWEIAAAVLTSASPQFENRTDALVRVTHRLEVK